MSEERRDGLSAEERAAIEAVTRRAAAARERFVRELDGLLYDLHHTDERRPPPPPEPPRDIRRVRGC